MKHNISSVILTVCVLFCACSQNPATDSSDFVFSTENIAGDEAYYSKPAVITGHIANRDVYPNVTEIGITIPYLRYGIIVDFGEHLRPSIPKTRETIEKYLE